MTKADGSKAAIEDVKNPEQKLDLWGGNMTSSFEIDGVPVRVVTAVIRSVTKWACELNPR